MIGQLLAAASPMAQRVPVETLHPSWCPPWAFWALSGLTVAGALVTITRRNLIGAVMALVATFFGLAGLYALLYAHFLAAIQVLVYAGAIMVLFIFVIMVLNHEDEDPWSLRNRLGKAVGIGALVYLMVRLGETISSGSSGAMVRGGTPPENFGSVGGIGEYFFTKFLFPFEAVSILLIIAVIAAVVVSRTVTRPTSVHDLPKALQPRDPAEADLQEAAADDHGQQHGGGH
jgi:NADH-quinone oxidoreductase subunit J